MKKESDAILMRVFIGESDKYDWAPFARFLIKFCKKGHLTGAAILN